MYNQLTIKTQNILRISNTLHGTVLATKRITNVPSLVIL